MTASFRALVVNRSEDGTIDAHVQQMTSQDLPPGDVTIRVHYSSVNYKDALAVSPNGRIVKSYPIIPGIDLAGIVTESRDERYLPGDEVIVTGYELGISHHGGFSEFARVRGDWIVPLPRGLTLQEAMALGTAGFTAALSIHRLEANGLTPSQGAVLVTGATGGVGSLAVSMLARAGYEIAAATGKENRHDYLRNLGAADILPRSELTPNNPPPLNKQRWAAAIDPVGGHSLAYILSTIQYGGSVAVSGLTGGTELPTTVYPFILRGVNLLGIDSVYCPEPTRRQLWERMAEELKPAGLLSTISKVITLAEVPAVIQEMLAGAHLGRTIVKLD
ncbi:NADPH:quinone oxidoreductase family protein [Paenibacillus mendelii]|uniref:Acryloyl-CoA reductase n=1 Tax=Paenibacillus mendelii TaxID=206163 RepID=A0ABV6JJ73_9BACL|nr:acryloyl-CoA reductase [Paenibacillus mendelii]MCQ6558777.1 acryloyl-CoA reductase [Paenibacillus mendelii]